MQISDLRILTPPTPSGGGAPAGASASAAGAGTDLRTNTAPVRVAENAPVSNETEQRADPKSLRAIVEQARAAVSVSTANLQFSIDEQSGETVVKVVDADTDEVIRQIPSEEMLALARNLQRMEGLLFDGKA
ncbi:MAG: flagellar protein FlaG [Burkholderiales bacterium]|jgi:flagellar protein FlaG|nr:flagellar protein FlaG [Burkholderiales bacterium]